MGRVGLSWEQRERRTCVCEPLRALGPQLGHFISRNLDVLSETKRDMSVRAVEDRFSLRSVVAEETASKPLVLVQTPLTGNDFSSTPAPKNGLKFDFSKLQKSAPKPSPSKIAEASLMESGKIPMSQSLKNPFAHNESSRADVMRLTAVVEDLNARLKKVTDKANHAEVQLQRAYTSLVAERNSANERTKSFNAQLGSARALEAQLREELAKSAKSATNVVQMPQQQKFEAAVAAAVAADDAVEKTQKEMEVLREKLASRDSEAVELEAQVADFQAKLATRDADAQRLEDEIATVGTQLASKDDETKQLEAQVVEFKQQVVEMSARMVELERQILVAKQELADAKNAEFDAAQVAAEAALAETAEVAEPALGEPAEPAEPVAAAEPAEPVEAAEPAEPALGEPVGTAEPALGEPALGEPVEPAEPVEVGEVGEAAEPADPAVPTVDPVDPIVEAPQPVLAPPKYLDPVKMHTRYNKLKDAYIKVSSIIEAIKEQGIVTDDYDKLVATRDKLYTKAKKIKTTYETVFGAAEPESVVEFSGKECFTDVDTQAAVQKLSSMDYSPTGDAPTPPKNCLVSFAREMAQTGIFGGALHAGELDLQLDIGACRIDQMTIDGEAVEPTESNDAKNDMVNAVVMDIKRLLRAVDADNKLFNKVLLERAGVQNQAPLQNVPQETQAY